MAFILKSIFSDCFDWSSGTTKLICLVGEKGPNKRIGVNYSLSNDIRSTSLMNNIRSILIKALYAVPATYEMSFLFTNLVLLITEALICLFYSIFYFL